MAYIGQQPVVGRYILLDQISGGFNGTTSGFTMSTAGGVQGVKPGLAQNVLLSLGGVIQQPGVDYTISGSGITFTTPPVAGTTFFATVLGDAQSVGTPSDGTVTPASIAAGYDFAFPNVNVTGVTTIASGVAATPSLSITGDADTGLFSSAANSVGVSTGGSERLRIDDSGRLLIGSSVAGDADADNINVAGGGNVGVTFRGSSSGTGNIFFADNTSGDDLKRGQIVYNHSGNSMRFHTNAVERLRIDSSGRVGISLTSPEVNLHTKESILVSNTTAGDGNGRIQIRAGAAAIDTSTHQIRCGGGSGQSLLIENQTNSAGSLTLASNHASGTINFKTNSAERLRIDSSGNVGVGTTSIDERLHVEGSGSNERIKIENTTSNIAGLVMLNTSRRFDIQVNGSDFQIFDNTGAAERLRIDSSGRLLVGASSSSGVGAKLQVIGDLGAQFHRGENSAGGASITISKSRNTTYGSNTIVQDDDTVGIVAFRADDGTDYNSYAALIGCHVDGTPGSNDMPGRLVFSTSADGANSPTERMRIDSAGNVGIGTTSPDAKLQLVPPAVDTNIFSIRRQDHASINLFRFFQDSNVAQGTGAAHLNTSNRDLIITASSTGDTDDGIYLETTGAVGIGTTSPTEKLSVAGKLHITNDIVLAQTNGRFDFDNGNSNGALRFHSTSGNAERMRLTSAGRLGLGTTSPVRDFHNANGVCLTTGTAPQYRLNGTASDGDDNDRAIFGLATASNHFFSSASAGDAVLRTTNAGNLLFGGGTTERMRITSGGDLLIGQNSTDIPGFGNTTLGAAFESLGADGTALFISRSGNVAAGFNRAQDGAIVHFSSAGTVEGTITISGTTTSYNGAHLSRWSQLAGGAERIEILRGSVLSNLDEMCEWGEEDNEQLNRMKVSDVEGDVNVAGIFQAWDDDDDTYTNDFYCAMTGDFVIRIAQGTTVARGDLLMSAGDGTAKPQDDDIVRSKTIAKVTSTTVSTTYADGSYCVPCVLMAC